MKFKWLTLIAVSAVVSGVKSQPLDPSNKPGFAVDALKERMLPPTQMTIKKDGKDGLLGLKGMLTSKIDENKTNVTANVQGVNYFYTGATDATQGAAFTTVDIISELYAYAEDVIVPNPSVSHSTGNTPRRCYHQDGSGATNTYVDITWSVISPVLSDADAGNALLNALGAINYAPDGGTIAIYADRMVLGAIQCNGGDVTIRQIGVAVFTWVSATRTSESKPAPKKSPLIPFAQHNQNGLEFGRGHGEYRRRSVAANAYTCSCTGKINDPNCFQEVNSNDFPLPCLQYYSNDKFTIANSRWFGTEC